MPQMFEYCGLKVPESTSEHTRPAMHPAPSGGSSFRMASISSSAETAEAFGGCQAGYLLFWKEAWLKPVDAEARAQADKEFVAQRSSPRPLAAPRTVSGGQQSAPRPQGEPTRYSCRGAEVLDFARPWKWWDARQYTEDWCGVQGEVGRAGPLALSTFRRSEAACSFRAARKNSGRPAQPAWLSEAHPSR